MQCLFLVAPFRLFCMYPIFCVFWILRNVNFCFFRTFKGLPFSTLLDIEWKLCAQTTSDVQTSKLAQRYTILACCWYQWCEYCRFVIFQLFFPETFVQSSNKQYWHQFSSFEVFYFLSLWCRVETVRTHYKRRANIKTYTMLYYISVLLVSVVWILSICHFPTVFPWNIWWKLKKQYLHQYFWASMCSLLSLFWLSSGNCAHTLQATYKHQNFDNVILY